jgi:NAD(P)-dependent dehydrogenase (short-subunit alcohol dehydrogenase family)
MARWFVRRGARNLILLSRSGAAGESSKELVQELELTGARVITPSCDVSDPQALKEVLDECAMNMPPIKGCIQASMVLKVRFSYHPFNST